MQAAVQQNIDPSFLAVRGMAAIRAAAPRLYFALFHHRTTKNNRLSFDKRQWLLEVYKDNSDFIVIQKASQVGITDWMLCDLFEQSSTGKECLYALPDDGWRNDFVPRRIDKQIQWSELYRLNCAQERKDSDKKSQKVFFGSNCRFVGTTTDKGFFEFPCDNIYFDEFDKCDQSNIAYAYDRQAASADPKWRKVGNPTVSDYGISTEYENSDHKEWFVKCEHCGEWQTPDWFANVVREGSGHNEYSLRHPDGLVVCQHCDKPIGRTATGEWVAAYPDRDVSGYQVNQIFGLPNTNTLSDMIKSFFAAISNQTKMQRFYNNSLGIIYDAQGAKITSQMLAACVPDEKLPNLNDPVYVGGIDVGDVWHLHISAVRGDRREKVFAQAVSGRAEAEKIVRRRGVSCGVIDAQGDLSAVREFVADNPVWWKCEYNKQEKAGEFLIKDEARHTVRVNRTESLDNSMQAYSDRNVILPPDWKFFDEGQYEKQMCVPTRIAEVAAGVPTGRSIWTKGVDHHRHACNYENVAFFMMQTRALDFAGGVF